MSIGADVDIDALLVAALNLMLPGPGFPEVRVTTALPATMPARVVRVTTAPGSLSDYDTSTLRVDLESFGGSRADARSVAGRVHRVVLALPGRRIGSQQFDAVRGGLPTYRFWSDTTYRFVATYEFDARVRI